MGHRSSKQLEEAPSKAIIFQTIHLNNLSILNLKMKIFFALALVIVFPRDVVLDADCDSGDTVPEISDDCLSEFNNMIVNGNMAAFYSRLMPKTHSKTDVPCVALQNVQADSKTLRTIWVDRRNGPREKALRPVKRLVTPAVVAQLLNTITLERKIINVAPTQGASVTY